MLQIEWKSICTDLSISGGLQNHAKMHGRCRTILSYGISGQGSQRLSLPSSATAILEYHYLDDFPDGELLNMIDHAYETVFNGFSKKVQKQILEEA